MIIKIQNTLFITFMTSKWFSLYCIYKLAIQQRYNRQLILHFMKICNDYEPVAAVLLGLNAFNRYTGYWYSYILRGGRTKHICIYIHLFNLPKYDAQFHSKENAKSVKRSCHRYNKTKMHAKTLSTRCHHINFFPSSQEYYRLFDLEI